MSPMNCIALEYCGRMSKVQVEMRQSISAGTTQAFAAHIAGGYTFVKVSRKPRLGISFCLGSSSAARRLPQVWTNLHSTPICLKPVTEPERSLSF
jgi:hypothetical protein